MGWAFMVGGWVGGWGRGEGGQAGAGAGPDLEDVSFSSKAF